MNELEFAKDLARQAGAIMRKNFIVGMRREWKGDGTPVTETDLAINSLVLNAIEKNYPAHSFVGEEGSNIKESEYTWVCDPVDGTIPFSHGYPTFAFSLALTKNGVPIIGVIYDPIMDRLLTAEKGKGAFLNRETVSVSSEKELSERSFVELDNNIRNTGISALLKEKGAWTPKFYSCVYAGLLVAVGEFTGAIYTYTKPWDAAAVKIIVEEAGGKVTDLEGNEQRYDTEINGFLASNGHVHAELVRALKQ